MMPALLMERPAMTLRLLALATLPLFAASCAPADPAKEAARSARALAAGPEAKVSGPAQRCIPRSQIRQTIVRSERVIDFEMQGGAVFRNTLSSTCPGLAFERAIAYETSIDQLCTPQIIYVLTNVGGVPQRGAGCSLGEFVPVEYVRKTKG
jgi:hypothetical protein